MHRYLREPFRSLSHLIGCGLSIFALVTLIRYADTNSQAIAVSIIYGVSLIVLYGASALFHGLHCSEELSSRLEKVDWAAIFILIAGTYTPVCLLVIGGTLGWVMFTIEWGAAIIGIYSICRGHRLVKSVQVAIYVVMGWLFLIGIEPLTDKALGGLFFWLVIGGIFYTVGAVIFLMDRPKLWEGYFEAHDLWHLMVLGGSASHFLSISRYVYQLSHTPGL